MLTIQDSTVAALETASTFQALLGEYGEASAIAGLPPPGAKMGQYRVLEEHGLLHVVSATVDNELVGLITVLYAPLPHYDGAAVAVSESFFVRPVHRKTGAGLKLLKAAEDKTVRIGCDDLMVTAPIDSELAAILPRRGYRMTNVVFMKKVRL